MEDFKLCQGVSADGTEKLRSSYAADGNNINGILSAELFENVIKGFIKLIPEPIFFFLELPDENGSYTTYYLDNCTKPVAHAVMKRYGQMLINDGNARFGFGSNKSEEEIYFTDFQEFSIYCLRPSEAEKLLRSVGAVRKDKPDSVWELLSDENEGSLSAVEYDGETVYDIPENLKSAGMYRSDEK